MGALTRPQHLDFVDWANQIVLDLSKSDYLMRPVSLQAWQEWGQAMVQVPFIAAFNPPNPYWFEQWQKWAERFVQGVQYE